jgi:hypothetical protein
VAQDGMRQPDVFPYRSDSEQSRKPVRVSGTGYRKSDERHDTYGSEGWGFELSAMMGG